MATWTVPGYTEVRELDDGGPGPGRTALATHAATGALVEIRYLADGGDRDDVRQQARRLAELDSPYVVGLYEYLEADGGVATVREHVDGVALPALLTGRALRPEAALTVLKAVLLGLTAAQLTGVRHHYSAANVLVGRAGHVKIAEGIGGEAPGTEADDIRAAFVTFLECLHGTKAASARLPKPLRGLTTPASAGDGVTLLAELDTAAPAYGAQWAVRGRRELARAVHRVGGA